MGRHPSAEAKLIRSLEDLLEPASVKAGERLYAAGDPPRGIYLLEKGRVAVDSLCRHKQTLESGALLGVAAALCGQPYHETAVALDDSRVSFVAREGFLQALQGDFAVCQQVLEMLSQEIDCCYGELRKLAVPHSRGRSRAAR